MQAFPSLSVRSMSAHLYSIIESPAHPELSAFYKKLGFREHRFTSMRKAISELKRHPPDVVVADFLYGYGNNYAGVNVSNLDVFLYSMQKYAPHARVVVFADKQERPYVDKLAELFQLEAVLTYPVKEQDMASLLG